MIGIYIVDDHPLVREGIQKVINNTLGIEITGTAANNSELMELLQHNVPDLLVLDITLPEKSGLDILQDLQNLYPKLPVLILSIHPPERFAIRALRAGASGYMCKSSISDNLVKAIRKIVNKKQRYISPDVGELLAQKAEGNFEKHEELTDRELQVLCLIATGESIKEIANLLSLSPNTIHSHRNNIKEKLNLDSDVDMTRYALHNNLVT